MSFSIRLKKNDETGTYDITASSPETLPDLIEIHGHVEEKGGPLDMPSRDVVDLTVRCRDLVAMASKRQQYFQV